MLYYILRPLQIEIPFNFKKLWISLQQKKNVKNHNWYKSQIIVNIDPNEDSRVIQ